MDDPNRIWLCTIHEERVSRAERTTSLFFDPGQGRFRIQLIIDYETKPDVVTSYSDADAYLGNHPEYRDKAKQAINDHLAKHPEHKKAMDAALARMQTL